MEKSKASIDDISPAEWDAVHRGFYSKPVKIQPADEVNHPEHYNVGNIEAIDYIEQQLGEGFRDYCIGNAHKYLHRYKYKGGKQDLEKCVWYINKAMESL